MTTSLFPVFRSFGAMNPFDMISHFDKTFDDYFNTSTSTSRQRNYSSMPRANVLKTKSGYCVEMAVPGFDRSDFEINVDNNNLTVSVSSTNNPEYEQSVEHKEFSYASFSRSCLILSSTFF